MKHIFNYLGALCTLCLFCVLGVSCSDDDNNGSANVGLGIKVFFPTKVVTNQPITINGSGFNDVTEIEFPGGTKVTSFEIVSDDMIRVNSPAGIAADGGKIVVRTANSQAESRLPLTVGHTRVSGFSKQPGETAAGGELITVYGTDLEFINSIELLDADAMTQLIDHKDFYRKGTSNLVFRVPMKNIYKGTFAGTLHTYDGQNISMPELAYEPAADNGHYEIVKTIIWKNPDSDGYGPANWNGTYRFAPETNSTSEEIAVIPMDIWEKMKTEKFYMMARGSDWVQMRIVTGWWNAQWPDANDITTGNEMIIDNGDGTYFIEMDLSGSDLSGAMDAEHLLFTGGGFTPLELYFSEEVWIDGGDDTPKEVTIWENDGSHGSISWSSDYRFAPETNSTNEEIAVIPTDIWENMKTGTSYLQFKIEDPSWYQIRITTGWWGSQWPAGKEEDITPNFMADMVIDNGDGTYHIELNLAGSDLATDMDAQHLLFTGSGYTPLRIYFLE